MFLRHVPKCDWIALLIVIVYFVVCGVVRGDDKTARERRVKVALALSATAKPTAPAVTAVDESCGKCREDFPAVWNEALALKKPIALFVGGACKSGMGLTAHEAGAIPAKVDTYPSDGKGTEPRVVMIKPTDGGMVVDATLPAKVTPKELTAAVVKATPEDTKPSHLPPVPPKSPAVAPVKLDWLVK